MGRRSGVDRKTRRSLPIASAGRQAGRREIESAIGVFQHRRKMIVRIIPPFLLCYGEDYRHTP